VDENTKLLLQKAGRALEWEDEERASYDQEALRQEFRRRLYAGQADGNGEEGGEKQTQKKE
jgi:hypothetical protein